MAFRQKVGGGSKYLKKLFASINRRSQEPSPENEVFQACYHPPPPGIGGSIRHSSIAHHAWKTSCLVLIHVQQ
jgi:hypothetical protein